MRNFTGPTAKILLSGALLGPVTCWPAGAKAPVKTYTIVIKGLQFIPAALRVAPNDTVIWVNTDIVPHTIMANKAFDSKNLAPGQSWSFVAKRKGLFNYACAYHPTMLGVVSVR